MIKRIFHFIMWTLFVAYFSFIGFFLWKVATLETPQVETTINLPPVGSVTPLEKPIYGSVVQLHVNGDFMCSGIVFDEQYVVTAAHCLINKDNLVEKSNYLVYDPENPQSRVIAKAAGVNRRLDYGILRGNFRRFEKAPLNVYNNEFKGGAYIACGYPFGQMKLSCMSVTPRDNYFFQIAAHGLLYPGMSGGPVYNIITGNVIGVNSAAGDGFILIAPLIGLYGSFGIESD